MQILPRKKCVILFNIQEVLILLLSFLFTVNIILIFCNWVDSKGQFQSIHHVWLCGHLILNIKIIQYCLSLRGGGGGVNIARIVWTYSVTE